MDALFIYNAASTGVGYLEVDMNASGTQDSNDIVILHSIGDQAFELVFADVQPPNYVPFFSRVSGTGGLMFRAW